MPITDELWNVILNAIYEGHTLEKTLKLHGVGRKAFRDYLSENLAREGEYMRARVESWHLRVDRMEDIAADASIDPGRARNMIDVTKWGASRIVPAVYGDRIDVNLQQTVDIGPGLLAARERLLSIRDQSNEVESQVIDITNVPPIAPTGSKPDSANDDAQLSNELTSVDIFD